METSPSIIDLQKMQEDETIVPFRIIGVGEKGFSAQLFDHKAFVSFFYMPFKHENIEVWKALLPYLKQTGFIGTIKLVESEKQFCILNAAIPQFETAELDFHVPIDGIIIQKFESHLILELGASFNWKYGSIMGFLPKSNADRIIYFKDLKVGNTLSVSICDRDVSQRVNYIVQGALSSQDWDKGKVWDLLNERVTARVIFHGDEKVFVVNGKYKGKLDTSDKWYKKSKLRYAIKSMVGNLHEKEEITVKVVRIKESSQTMEIVWVIDKRLEDTHLNHTKNTIGDILGNMIDLSSFDD